MDEANNQLGLDFESNDANEEKNLQIKKERQELLSNVISGNLTTTREKVAYILNSFTSSRNSDIELAWNFWTAFESDKFDTHSITKKQMKLLSRMNSLIRARAKIQNEYRLFQADDTVKKYRGVLEEQKKHEAIEDKPKNLPVYSVFIDETGKTQKFLSIGSLWVIDGGISSYKTSQEITKWKKENSINYEFHFSQVKKSKVQEYKDFFLKFLSLNPTVGFKVIVVQNIGFRDISKPITDLTFHLINKGIDHENSTGRAPLPRILQVWLDQEEKGSDNLKIENVKERIISQKIEDLYLGNFEAVNSEDNHYIQATDLFIASVNRKLHVENNSHFKDDLAEYILDMVKFDINLFNKENSNIDSATVFNLSDFQID